MSEVDLAANRSPPSTTRQPPTTRHPSSPTPTRPASPRSPSSRGTTPGRSYCARSSRRRHGTRSSATAPSPTARTTGLRASPAPSTSRARNSRTSAWAESGSSDLSRSRLPLRIIGEPWNAYRRSVQRLSANHGIAIAQACRAHKPKHVKRSSHHNTDLNSTPIASWSLLWASMKASSLVFASSLLAAIMTASAAVIYSVPRERTVSLNDLDRSFTSGHLALMHSMKLSSS